MGAPESEPDGIMNSRVSWSVDGIDPSVRERAEAAARRALLALRESEDIGDDAFHRLEEEFDFAELSARG